MRIGHGYDVHRLEEGLTLTLCGVKIPYKKGLLGHSDADVAVHALMDALLGAAALGDIGCHFPDTDPKYKGISSLELLSFVVDLLKRNDFCAYNIDITIIAQEPKLKKWIPNMRETLLQALNLPHDRVSVKATTEEGLGVSAHSLGIAAHCVCLITEILD